MKIVRISATLSWEKFWSHVVLTHKCSLKAYSLLL